MKLSQNNLLPKDGELYHHKNFFTQDEKFLQHLIDGLKWRNDKIKMFGKVYDQKRKVAWCGDPGTTYIYSGIKLSASGWTPEVLFLKEYIHTFFGVNFNSCLVNLYRHGDDYMSYHSDSEEELGENPEIFSISFGANRDFLLKHNESKEVVKLNLNHGDLVIMRGKTQHFWKHSIPKRKRVEDARVNLTFRRIY